MLNTLPAHARKFFQRYIECGELGEQGFHWLMNYINPFSNYDQTLAGFPDSVSVPSLVRRFRYQVAVDKPPNLPAGTQFYVHCIFTPYMAFEGVRTNPQQCLNQVRIPPGGDIQAATIGGQTPTLYPGWTIITSSQEDYFETTGATQQRTYATLSMPRRLTNSRLVFSAIKVVNTTAELYRSGAVTTVPLESHWSRHQILLQTSGGQDYYSSAKFNTCVSAHGYDQASEYNQAATWGAEHGIYMPARMSDTENAPSIPESTNLIAVPLRADDTTSRIGFSNIGSGLLGQTQRAKHMNWGSSYAVFSGLNENSTLEISVVYGIEEFPTPQNVGDLQVTLNQVPQDDFAIELATRITAMSPISGKADENGFGDFLKKAVVGLGEIAPVLGTAIGTPWGMSMEGGLVGETIRTLTRRLDKADDRLGNLRLEANKNKDLREANADSRFFNENKESRKTNNSRRRRVRAKVA